MPGHGDVDLAERLVSVLLGSLADHFGQVGHGFEDFPTGRLEEPIDPTLPVLFHGHRGSAATEFEGIVAEVGGDGDIECQPLRLVDSHDLDRLRAAEIGDLVFLKEFEEGGDLAPASLVEREGGLFKLPQALAVESIQLQPLEDSPGPDPDGGGESRFQRLGENLGDDEIGSAMVHDPGPERGHPEVPHGKVVAREGGEPEERKQGRAERVLRDNRKVGLAGERRGRAAGPEVVEQFPGDVILAHEDATGETARGGIDLLEQGEDGLGSVPALLLDAALVGRGNPGSVALALLVTGHMLLPGPTIQNLGRGHFRESGGIPEGPVDGVDHRRSGSVGNPHAFFLDALRIALPQFPEEPGVPTPPAIDRLFDIPDHKEAAGSGSILDHLVDEVFDGKPLQPAGVLELVEQPVVDPAVEPVVERHPAIRGVGIEREEGIVPGLGRPGFGTHQDAGEIAVGQAAPIADQLGVEVLVTCHHAVDSPGALEPDRDFPSHEGPHQVLERLGLGPFQRVLDPIHREAGRALRLQDREVGDELVLHKIGEALGPPQRAPRRLLPQIRENRFPLHLLLFPEPGILFHQPGKPGHPLLEFILVTKVEGQPVRPDGPGLAPLPGIRRAQEKAVEVADESIKQPLQPGLPRFQRSPV